MLQIRDSSFDLRYDMYSDPLIDNNTEMILALYTYEAKSSLCICKVKNRIQTQTAKDVSLFRVDSVDFLTLSEINLCSLSRMS